MGNKCVTPAVFAWIGDHSLDPAGRAVNFNTLVDSRFQMRKRSTI